MARMLGENFLPESVQSARRRVRNRVQDVRQPIRQRREDLVPGPDVIGMTEQRLSGLRDRFVSRDGLLSRVREQAPTPDMGSSSDGSADSTNNGSPPAT